MYSNGYIYCNGCRLLCSLSCIFLHVCHIVYSLIRMTSIDSKLLQKIGAPLLSTPIYWGRWLNCDGSIRGRIPSPGRKLHSRMKKIKGSRPSIKGSNHHSHNVDFRPSKCHINNQKKHYRGEAEQGDGFFTNRKCLTTIREMAYLIRPLWRSDLKLTGSTLAWFLAWETAYIRLNTDIAFLWVYKLASRNILFVSYANCRTDMVETKLMTIWRASSSGWKIGGCRIRRTKFVFWKNCREGGLAVASHSAKPWGPHKFEPAL